jgi:phospholipase/lecithinase/hemolysin
MRQTRGVNILVRFTLFLLLSGPVVLPAQAAFSSLYVFGDGASTTTNNTTGGSLYFGKRYCNGRVWVEVLAQWQGMTYESNKNWSFFGHYSPNLVSNVNTFTAPPDAATALFVVWINNADFVDDMAKVYPSTTVSDWTTANNVSLTNHWKAITNLYAKGARTIILPNAVDITKIPNYAGVSAAQKTFIRQRVIEFNAGFSNLLNQVRTGYPGVTIYSPDVFTLLDKVIATSASYGLTNALFSGQSIDVEEDPALADKSFTGPGAIYIFWDPWHPTAKLQMWIADLAQQLLSQPRIGQITALSGTNRLDLVNVPVGRNGVAEGTTNFLNWVAAGTVTSTNTSQPLFIPTSGPSQFYRLRFPFAWTWP